MEGWRVASKRLGALPRIKRGALDRGCGRDGSGALPLARAVDISTRLRCLWLDVRPLRPAEAWVGKHAACVVDAGKDRLALLLERGEPGRLGGWAGRPCRLARAAAGGDASVQEAERGDRSYGGSASPPRRSGARRRGVGRCSAPRASRSHGSEGGARPTQWALVQPCRTCTLWQGEKRTKCILQEAS